MCNMGSLFIAYLEESGEFMQKINSNGSPRDMKKAVSIFIILRARYTVIR